MNLTLREKDKLLIAMAAMVARRRLERGVKLNHPETIALITDFVGEGARGRLTRLVNDERMKVQRVASGVPVTVLYVGHGEDEVSIDKLASTIKALPKKIDRATMAAVIKRIDSVSQSLLAVSDRQKDLAKALEACESKVDRAKIVGAAVAKACLGKGITKVVFDRNGYLYHGRVSALADAAREGGLDF